jgi:ribonucleoside-diphosphate reductase alpha chain
MFISVGKAGSDVTAMAEALGKIISLTLRMASPIPPMERAHKIASMLIGIGGARSLGFGENRVRSLPDAIAKVIDRHFGFFKQHRVDVAPPLATNGNGNGHQAATTVQEAVAKLTSTVAPAPVFAPPAEVPKDAVATSKRMVTVDLCPKCGEASLVFEESCKKCYSCGYSEC